VIYEILHTCPYDITISFMKLMIMNVFFGSEYLVDGPKPGNPTSDRPRVLSQGMKRRESVRDDRRRK
jgi:hypothetical protein